MKQSRFLFSSPMRTLASLLLIAVIIRISSYNLSVRAQIAPAPVQEITTDSILDIPFSKDSLERILDAFKQRETQLLEAEAELESRRQTLNRTKSDILSKISELENLETRLAATLAIADSGAEDDINKLASVYENMKPKDSAELFAVMAPNFAAGFLSRMQPESAAAILSELEPSTSHAISVIFAGRNANAFNE